MPPAASYASSTWSLRYTSPANRRRTTLFTASAPSVSASSVSAVPGFPAASSSVGFSIMIVVSSAPRSLSSDSETDPSISFPVESAPSAPASPSVPVTSPEAVRLPPILQPSDGTRFSLSGRSIITPSATMMPSRRILHSPTQRFVPLPLSICSSSFRRLRPCSLRFSCSISLPLFSRPAPGAVIKIN